MTADDPQPTPQRFTGRLRFDDSLKRAALRMYGMDPAILDDPECQQRVRDMFVCLAILGTPPTEESR